APSEQSRVGLVACEATLNVELATGMPSSDDSSTARSPCSPTAPCPCRSTSPRRSGGSRPGSAPRGEPDAEGGDATRPGRQREESAALARHEGALLGVHLVADAGALAAITVTAALGEEVLIGLGGDVGVGLLVADLHAERLLDQVDVVHANRV